jgi:hypothetical protein
MDRVPASGGNSGRFKSNTRNMIREEWETRKEQKIRKVLGRPEKRK